MSAEALAIVEEKTGVIDVRTVAPTEVAVMVNFLCLAGFFIGQKATEAEIRDCFRETAPKHGAVIETVTIIRGRVS